MKTILELKVGRKNFFCEGREDMVHNFIRNSSCENRIMLQEVDNPDVRVSVRCRDVNVPKPRPTPEPVLMVQ